MGVIVAFDILPSRFVFVLDDSSGETIEVTCERPKSSQQLAVDDGTYMRHASADFRDIPMDGLTCSGKRVDLAGIDVGSVVKIKGLIGAFRTERQLSLERIWALHNTNEEVAAWVENGSFISKILNKPWIVSAREIKAAQRKARVRDNENSRGRHPSNEAAAQRKKSRSEKGDLTDSTNQAGRLDRNDRNVSNWVLEKTKHKQREKHKRGHELAGRLGQQCEAEKRVRPKQEDDAASHREAKRMSPGLTCSKAKEVSTCTVQTQQIIRDQGQVEREQAQRQREVDRAERERLFAERKRFSSSNSGVESSNAMKKA